MHLVSPEFGENVSITDALRDALKKAPALCATDARILLRELYETTYGIFNHDSELANSRPMALVAMHWAEDNTTGSPLYERISQFSEKNVNKYFGISLLEFLALPRDVNFHVLELASKRTDLENTVAGNVISQLGGKP